MHPLCHHFASVVRPYTITKNYSPLKPLGHLRPNLVEWSVGDLLPKLCPVVPPNLCLVVPPSDQDGCTAELSLT
jgi:hypothetical protein